MIHKKSIAAIRLAVIAVAGIASKLLAADYKLPPVSTQQNVTYETDIRPIFEKNCFKCHGEFKLQRHLRLDSLESVLKGCEDGPVIFPGKSDQGELILEAAGLGRHDMPPPPSTPTPLPSTTTIAPTTKFLSKLIRTPNGQYIIGLTNPVVDTASDALWARARRAWTLAKTGGDPENIRGCKFFGCPTDVPWFHKHGFIAVKTIGQITFYKP